MLVTQVLNLLSSQEMVKIVLSSLSELVIQEQQILTMQEQVKSHDSGGSSWSGRRHPHHHRVDLHQRAQCDARGQRQYDGIAQGHGTDRGDEHLDGARCLSRCRRRRGGRDGRDSAGRVRRQWQSRNTRRCLDRGRGPYPHHPDARYWLCGEHGRTQDEELHESELYPQQRQYVTGQSRGQGIRHQSPDDRRRLPQQRLGPLRPRVVRLRLLPQGLTDRRVHELGHPV